MCVTGRAARRLPVARQHRFIHHRDEEGTSGVKDCGEELQVSRVVDGILAAFGGHRGDLSEGRKTKTERRTRRENKPVRRGGAVPGLVTAGVEPERTAGALTTLGGRQTQ